MRGVSPALALGLGALLASSIAAAQPAPPPPAFGDPAGTSSPTDPASAPTDPASAPADPAASASAGPPGPAPGHRPGDELPRGAWPGVGLESLRGLPECTMEDPPAVVGQPVTCRPPVLPARAHVSFDASWVTGLVLDSGDVRGVQGFAADAAYWLTRSLGLGVRYQFAGLGTATPAMAEPRAGRVGEGLVTLHWRAFTDEVDRDAFELALGGGYATRDDSLGGSGPVARVALSRDLGWGIGEHGAMTWAWELAAEQGLDGDQLRTITAGVRVGGETGIRKPGNVGEPDQDPPVRFAIGGEFRASPQVGLGGSFALPVARPVLWRTTAFWTTGHDDTGEHGLRATWAALTGPHVRFARGVLAPYLDVQAGPAAIGGDPSAKLGWLAESEAGLEIHAGCQTRIDLGGRIQAELDGGFGVRTGFFVLRIEHGTALRLPGQTCTRDVPRAY